ncbi:MAG TPA: hypothetical protein VFZ36_06225 [Vicinamibacterales bacterium]
MKHLARALLPTPLATRIAAQRARRHSHHLNRQWGVARLSERLLDELGPAVLAGPFAGLVLPRAAAAEHLGPYLLGTYERELHPYWTELARETVPRIVNVGAKVGYYAAGLSRLLGAPAVAFDADPWARRVLKATVRLNRADVAIRGACTRGDLQDLPPGTLVMVDCDGCEDVLLRDPLPSGLLRSRLVVELHGALLADDATAARLARTHDVRGIPTEPAPPPPAVLDFLDARERALAVEELRQPQRWLLCTPRT